MHRGYIKLWRKIKEWEWYNDTKTFHIFIHLIIVAQHKDSKWRGIPLLKGEIIHSLETIAKDCGLTVQNVRTSIKRLKSTGELTQRQHGKFRILKVEKYPLYCGSNTETNSQLTAIQQGSNSREELKELKNEKKEKKEISTNVDIKASPLAEGPKKENESISENGASGACALEDPPSSAPPPSYGNPEINKMLEALKAKIGIDAFADGTRWERIYAKHCLSLMQKIGKDEFVRRLEIILDDDFKHKNCNRIKFVYNELKGFIEPTQKSRVAFIS